MKKLHIGTGALLGGLLTAPMIGLMYLGDKLLGLPFVPYDLFDWITRVLPGPVVTFGIDLMIDTMRLLGISVADSAKTAEQISAVLNFFVIGIVTGIIFYAILSLRVSKRGHKPDLLTGLVIGGLFGLPLIAISTTIGQSTLTPIVEILWLAVLFLGWGVAFSRIAGRLLAFEPAEEAAPIIGAPKVGAPSEDGDVEAEAVTVAAAPGEEVRSVDKINRRQFLIRLGASSATITIVSAGLGAVLATSERRRLEEELEGTMVHQAEGASASPFPNSNDPVVPAPGTRPEYTPLKDHYSVFIRTEPSVIDGASWVLPITGLVDNPLMLTLDDFKNNYESRDQYVTLSCISGRVGTTLISTTQWTGVSVQDVLADAQLRPEARYLYITSEDGFHETVDLDMINSDERIMFCYAWDGNDLPSDHGYPLRIWLPDRFGMKQPKWITGIEVIEEYAEGYWVIRNWDEEAIVKGTSVIDTVALDAIVEDGDQQLVPVGGIAFCGDRGISKVELRVDGGPWQEAQLRSPLSETTWVIWRYEWPFNEGEHTFEVRCQEGDGTPQIEEEEKARPSGATGIHSKNV